jgi:hypothetical protein
MPGKFVAPVRGSKTNHPEDLPSAGESAKQYPDGVIYSHDTGRRFRLRHPQPARWEEVFSRKRGGNGTSGS